MNKIPVGETIGAAYRFAFMRFFGNLGVVWAPLVLLLAAAWYTVPSAMNSWGQMIATIPVAPGSQPDPQLAIAMMGKMLHAYRLMMVLWIVAVLLRTQMMLGLTQRALGTFRGPAFVYLSLGKAFWRLTGAYFAVLVILFAVEMALTIALIVAGAIVGIVTGAAGGGQGATALVFGGGVGIGVLVVMCALFYIAVRLTFLLTPVIVAEEKFDLVRPWRLAGGNFWRIVVIGVVIFVPLSIATGALYIPLEFGMMKELISLPAVQAHDPQAGAKLVMHIAAAFAELVKNNWYLLVPLIVISSTLFYGIAAGASVAAYRALVPDAESEPAAK